MLTINSANFSRWYRLASLAQW